MLMEDVFDPGRMDNEERDDWLRLTPAQRYVESGKLWDVFIGFGGSLDPEPDSQSPFDFPEMRRPVSPDGRTGVHFIRRR